MVRKRQSGFTLVELVVVMAISTLLIGVALAGFSVSRRQAQFTTAIDVLAERIIAQKTETQAGVPQDGGINPGRGGTLTTEVLFGRRIDFNVGSDIMTVDQLYANDQLTTCNIPYGLYDLLHCVPGNNAIKDYKFDAGVTYAGNQGPHVILFITRSLTDGTLFVNIIRGPIFAEQYNVEWMQANGRADMTLEFRDPDGRRAFIDVSPTRKSIVRRFP